MSRFIPINGNADPLSLDSGRAVTGGYSGSGVGFGDGLEDCGCSEPVNDGSEFEEVIPVSDQPDYGCDEGVHFETGITTDSPTDMDTSEIVAPFSGSKTGCQFRRS